MTTLFLNYHKCGTLEMLGPADDCDKVLLSHLGYGPDVPLDLWQQSVKTLAEAHGWEVRIGGLPPHLE